MRSSWLLMNVLCFVVLTRAQEALQVKESSSKELEQDLRSLSTQVSYLTIKVNQLMTEQSKLAEKMDKLMNVNETEPRNPKLDVIFGECPELPAKGVYQFKTSFQLSSSFPVYCEEGWIVIQRRIDGSLSFNRNWNDYRGGFGDVRGEHWLGLERMHQITHEGSYELMVVLKGNDGVENRVKYGWIKIASENEQYRLDLGAFSEGDVQDSLAIHNGTKFSTPDRDNDNNVGKNCAKLFGSGWWFTENCYYANLNGESGGPYSKIEWYDDLKKYEGFSEARMMIRAIK